MDYFIIILFSILIIILLIGYYNRFILDKQYLQEKFINKMNSEENKYTIGDNYLYPVKGLSGQCEKLGLKPAYMPQICTVNGVVNSYANCMCQDKNGNCQKCYPELEKYNKASHVVYNDNVSIEYTPYNIKSVNPDILVDKNNQFDIPGIGSNNNFEQLPQPLKVNGSSCSKYYDELQKCTYNKLQFGNTGNNNNNNNNNCKKYFDDLQKCTNEISKKSNQS